jgi:hypothetical protein
MADRDGAQERETAGTVDDHEGIRLFRAPGLLHGLSPVRLSGSGTGEQSLVPFLIDHRIEIALNRGCGIAVGQQSF